MVEAGIPSFEIFFPDRDEAGNVISVTLRKDAVKSQNDALLEIYRKLRPGDPPTLDTATQFSRACSSMPGECHRASKNMPWNNWVAVSTVGGSPGRSLR